MLNNEDLNSYLSHHRVFSGIMEGLISAYEQIDNVRYYFDSIEENANGTIDIELRDEDFNSIVKTVSQSVFINTDEFNKIIEYAEKVRDDRLLEFRLCEEKQLRQKIKDAQKLLAEHGL